MTHFVLSALLSLAAQEGAPLIERLGHDDVVERDRISRDLRRRLTDVEPALRAGLRHADAEVRARCADLLDELAAARRAPPPSASGKLVFVDEKGGRVALDRRARDGAKIGDAFEVHREGARVGRVEITEVHPWGSWARPSEGTDFSTLRKGDATSPAKDP